MDALHEALAAMGGAGCPLTSVAAIAPIAPIASIAWIPARLPQFVDEPVLAVLLSPWARVAALAWGLLWGSFANVVIHRVPLGLSVVRPRSRCSNCEHPIAAYDNIPVISYLLLRGRCRHCDQPVAIRYLVVELLVGVLSFALYLKYVYVPLLAGEGPGLGAWLLWFVFVLGLLVVAYVDLDHWIVPDSIVLPLAVVGIVAAVWDPMLLGTAWAESVAAAAIGFAAFAAIRAFYLRFRGVEGLGLGDAKLLLMVGAFTGFAGLAWTVGAGALQGVLVSIPLLRSGRRIANRELHEAHGDDPTLVEGEGVMAKHVPFGPFLALAALEFVLLRAEILALGERWLLAG